MNAWPNSLTQPTPNAQRCIPLFMIHHLGSIELLLRLHADSDLCMCHVWRNGNRNLRVLAATSRWGRIGRAGIGRNSSAAIAELGSLGRLVGAVSSRSTPRSYNPLYASNRCIAKVQARESSGVDQMTGLEDDLAQMSATGTTSPPAGFGRMQALSHCST